MLSKSAFWGVLDRFGMGLKWKGVFKAEADGVQLRSHMLKVQGLRCGKEAKG